ncbi:MAG: CotH kinase family protein [Polyangiaceae bacterium]
MAQHFGTVAAFAAALVSGCGSDDDPLVVNPTGAGGRSVQSGGATSVGGTSGTAVETLAGFRCSDPNRTISDCDAKELFEASKISTFDLTLPTAAWEALQKNALDEKYTEAEVAFDGTSIGKIGLRFKGAHSTLVECVDTKGNLSCPKLSMKLKFHEYRSDLRFFGLTRINLHSMRHDASHLRERIAYRLYREMDVIAPRSHWANVRVNGETLGLFSLVEQIDESFVDDHWPESAGGNLYKEAMFSFAESTEFEGDANAAARATYQAAVASLRTDAYLTARLQTNEGTPDHSRLREFVDALEDASPDQRSSVIERYMDRPYLARYFAVDDAIYDWDGMTAIYSGMDYSWMSVHNYYLYSEPNRNALWPVPWDMDKALNTGSGFSIVPHWTQTPTDCSRLYPVFGGKSSVLAPGCIPFFQSLAHDTTSYGEAVRRLLDGPFAESYVLGLIDSDAALIEPAVSADPLGPSVVAWRAAVTRLKRDILTLRQRVQRIAAGAPVAPLTFSATRKVDFEDLDELEVLFGPVMMTNPNSDGRQFLNADAPLAGSRDLKIAFEYGNELKAWDQWMYFSVPIREGSVDARTLNGVRLRVRADRQRILRLELESPAQTRTDLGIRNGWDVPAGPDARLVEVTFSSAAVPSWSVQQGTDPEDDRDAVLSSVTGLAFHPYCIGRSGNGYLPGNMTDAGWVQIDDVELF